MSKVQMLRALVTEKMAVAVKEVLAVVDATVAGYEKELMSLRRELRSQKREPLSQKQDFGHRRHMDALLQPYILLQRLDVDDTGGTKGIDIHGASINCVERNGVDVVKTLTEDSDDSVSHLENTNSEKRCRGGQTSEVQIARSKRKRRLPGRYRTSPDVTDEDIEKKKNNQNKNLQSSNVRKSPAIKVQMCLWKNCPDSDCKDKGLKFKDSIKTIFCPQDLSEADFLKRLRSIFPALGRNKPFEAYLTEDKPITKCVPKKTKKLTQTELHRAFKSHQRPQFQFYLQPKEHEETCDTDVKTPRDKITSGLTEEASTQTGGPDEKPDKQDDAFSMDCAASMNGDKEDAWSPEENSEDGQKEEDDVCSPEQNSKHDKHGAPPMSNKYVRKRKEKALNCCKLCGIGFNSTTILTKHAMSHLGDSRCVCGVCGQRLKSSKQLKTHLETHQKLHHCLLCGRYFISYVTFHKHTCAQNHDPLKVEVRCEKMKLYKCDVCPEVFASQAGLCVHSRKHAGEAPTDQSYNQHTLTRSREKCTCQECGKRFHSEKQLTQHKKIHTLRSKSYLCEICSETFYTMQVLKRHQKIHRERSHSKCTFCRKIVLKEDFKRHMMTHTGEKTPSCKKCGMNFRSQKYLRSHMNSHLGIKRHACTLCGFRSVQKSNLTSHMRTHAGHRPHKCTVCYKTFTVQRTLKMHMKRLHQQDQETESESPTLPPGDRGSGVARGTVTTIFSSLA